MEGSQSSNEGYEGLGPSLMAISGGLSASMVWNFGGLNIGAEEQVPVPTESVPEKSWHEIFGPKETEEPLPRVTRKREERSTEPAPEIEHPWMQSEEGRRARRRLTRTEGPGAVHSSEESE